MILAGGQRRKFNEKQLAYLFSHDLALEAASLGFVPGGMVLQTRAVHNGFAVPEEAPSRRHTEGLSSAFHVRGDSTVLGNDAVEGKVVWFDERLFLNKSNDTGDIEARLTVRTIDDALIWTRYTGKLRLGRMGYRRLLIGTRRDEPEGFSDYELKAFITPRFETDSSKYRWLTERQCVAYGQVSIKAGRICSAKYDVYSAS